MSDYMMVRHKVRDYAAWKPGYDDHAHERDKAGLIEQHLLRGVEDPSEIIILFEAEDLQKAKAFAESEDLRKKMEEVGVVDKPDIFLLNDDT